MANVITRRSFLHHGLAGVSLAATAPHFLGWTSRSVAAEPGDEDRILVVLQMSGGNDGLSMVVPYADSAYYSNRSAAAIKDGEVLKLDEQVGLHPALVRYREQFGQGRLAIVQGVSYPNPNRSHFKSMDVWHTGDLDGRRSDTGWIGRAVDACCPDEANPNLVVHLGESIPYALEAKVHKPVSFRTAEQYRWTGNPRDKESFADLNGERPEGSSAISWLHRVAVDARASSDTIRSAAANYQPRARYAGTPLARDLRTVAALIGQGIGTRVYYVSFGGFDTHNNQRGRHDNLMRQLDGAVGSFLADLEAQGLDKKVLLVSFSEFGRRVKENASGGTDHGVAGPMFVFGRDVQGGLHGRHPSLTDLDKGDLKMQVDFRSVYASVLDDWMGFPSKRVLDGRFPALDLM